MTAPWLWPRARPGPMSLSCGLSQAEGWGRGILSSGSPGGLSSSCPSSPALWASGLALYTTPPISTLTAMRGPGHPHLLDTILGPQLQQLMATTTLCLTSADRLHCPRSTASPEPCTVIPWQRDKDTMYPHCGGRGQERRGITWGALAPRHMESRPQRPILPAAWGSGTAIRLTPRKGWC